MYLQNHSNDSPIIAEKLHLNIEELKEKYINYTFFCQQCTLGIVTENSFVDCNFPQLITMTLKNAQSWSFVRCTFPKLRTVNFTHTLEVNSIFVSCKFSGYMDAQLKSEVYSSCYTHGNHDDLYGFLYDLNDSFEWHAQSTIEILDESELDKWGKDTLFVEESPDLNTIINTSYIDDLT